MAQVEVALSIPDPTGSYVTPSLPAISVPAGFSSAGLPVGMQIAAMRHRDQLLLDVARFVEQMRPWPLIVHRPATVA